MLIRKAKAADAHDLKVLYFDFLTHYPPKEEQDMDLWAEMLTRFEQDDNMHLLVVEEGGVVVSSIRFSGNRFKQRKHFKLL